MKRKMYLEMSKKEILKLSIFNALVVCIIAGSFKYGLVSFLITTVVWSVITYIINLVWFAYCRKAVNKIAEYVKGKVESLKRAGKQNAVQSDK